MKEIYLDNSATTQVDDRVIDYITKVMREHYGNPSSLYDLGLQSHLLMEEAAKSAAALIGGKGENLYFTSGGTESNNWAVFGTAHAKRRRGKRMVTTAFEHSSILEPMKRLGEEGRNRLLELCRDMEKAGEDRTVRIFFRGSRGMGLVYEMQEDREKERQIGQLALQNRLAEAMETGGMALAYAGAEKENRGVKQEEAGRAHSGNARGYVLKKGDWSPCSAEELSQMHEEFSGEDWMD